MFFPTLKKGASDHTVKLRTFFSRFYLFDSERAQAGWRGAEKGSADGEGEAGSPQSREPKQVSIPGSWDQYLSWRHTLNRLNHEGAPKTQLSYM